MYSSNQELSNHVIANLTYLALMENIIERHEFARALSNILIISNVIKLLTESERDIVGTLFQNSLVPEDNNPCQELLIPVARAFREFIDEYDAIKNNIITFIEDLLISRLSVQGTLNNVLNSREILTAEAPSASLDLDIANELMGIILTSFNEEGKGNKVSTKRAIEDITERVSNGVRNCLNTLLWRVAMLSEAVAKALKDSISEVVMKLNIINDKVFKYYEEFSKLRLALTCHYILNHLDVTVTEDENSDRRRYNFIAHVISHESSLKGGYIKYALTSLLTLILLRNFMKAEGSVGHCLPVMRGLDSLMADISNESLKSLTIKLRKNSEVFRRIYKVLKASKENSIRRLANVLKSKFKEAVVRCGEGTDCSFIVKEFLRNLKDVEDLAGTYAVNIVDIEEIFMIPALSICLLWKIKPLYDRLLRQGLDDVVRIIFENLLSESFHELLVLTYAANALCSGMLPLPHVRVENSRNKGAGNEDIIDDIDLVLFSLTPTNEGTFNVFPLLIELTSTPVNVMISTNAEGAWGADYIACLNDKELRNKLRRYARIMRDLGVGEDSANVVLLADISGSKCFKGVECDEVLPKAFKCYYGCGHAGLTFILADIFTYLNPLAFNSLVRRSILTLNTSGYAFNMAFRDVGTD